MAPDTSRKLALFLSLLLLAAGVLTMVPDAWFLGSPACHSCHEAQYPASHMLFRLNYMGYDSLCSFAPFSTLILVGISMAIFLTTFRIKFERWGKEYRLIASIVLVASAALTLLPVKVGYKDLAGWDTLCPAAPLSTLLLLGLAFIALMGYMVCPFLVLMRCRCPVLEHELDPGHAPSRSVVRYCMMLLGREPGDEGLRRLYRCTLCNGCWLSAFNRSTRVMAVRRGMSPAHLLSIKSSIDRYGNPYGTVLATDGGADVGTISDTILFKGCTARLRAPEILTATKKLLDRKGISYRILGDESCCGYTLFNLGDVEAGYRAVDRNIEAFKAAGVKRIITICPGCYSAFSQYYKGRNGFNPEVVLAVDLLKGMAVPAHGVTVHDPCHAKEKRELVRSMLKGSREEGTGACCGAGGGVMSFDHMLAGARAARIFEENSGKIVTYCPFCYLNLSRAKPDSVTDAYVLIAGGGLHA